MEKKAIEYKLSATKGNLEQKRIISSDDASQYARNFYHEDFLIYESSFIIMLNNAHNAIAWAKISQGGISSTLVDTRIVAKYAIDSLASGVIFVHNHPSGSKKPSLHDNNITKKIKDALKLFDIQLIDSIIITENDYYSFQDEGML